MDTIVYDCSDSVLDFKTVVNILTEPDDDKISSVPPTKPRGGEMYLIYNRREATCDQYMWCNKGCNETPKKNLVMQRRDFKLKRFVGDRIGDSGFRQVCYFSHMNDYVLVHYIGDKSLFVARPHRNSKQNEQDFDLQYNNIVKLYQVRLHVYGRSQQFLRFLSSEIKSSTDVKVTATEADDEVTNYEKHDELYRERFIPITRRSVVRHIMQEENFLTEEEKKKFEAFAFSLDTAIVNKYHGILQELKSMFDPLNPDKDTIQTRQWNRRERLDNEFWLLQRLEEVMEKANFHELPKSVVKQALEEHEANEGVKVSVDADRYDILRFWALGKEAPAPKLQWYRRIWLSIRKSPPPKPIEYYKRVVVVIRLKRDQKLTLKAFKEVPCNALEKLLPDGKISMSAFDRGIIAASFGIASVTVLAKVVSSLAHKTVDWMLLVTAATAFIGARSWAAYKNRRNRYLVDLSKLLYFKNIANNRGLLTLLIDRAEDESFKESLLTYTFLLTERPPSVRGKESSQQLPTELGGIQKNQLDKNIEEWVQERAGIQITFDSTEGISLLKHFGLLSEINDKLHVLPLGAAMNNLPQQPQTLVARGQDADITEGYDRDIHQETEEEYKEEEKKTEKIGWH